jgi:hypothetical protein
MDGVIRPAVTRAQSGVQRGRSGPGTLEKRPCGSAAARPNVRLPKPASGALDSKHSERNCAQSIRLKMPKRCYRSFNLTCDEP